MKKQSKGIINYFEQKGFYIVIALCVLSIGAAGAVYMSGSGDEEPQIPQNVRLEHIEIPEISLENFDEPIVNNEPVEIDEEPDNNTTPTERQTDSPVDEDVPNLPYDIEDTSSPKDKDEVKVDNIVKNVTEEPEFVRPVSGTIVHGFSGEDMEYSETLEDWRVHAGTDFEAKYGEQVKAISDGTVEDIYFDEVYGQCILIDHGNGTKTLYTGLMEAVAVETGEKITAGTVIGGFGNTAIFEVAEEPRLHVELIQNGVRTNLESILP